MHRWPLRTAFFWEEAPFFRLLLPFGTAIFLYDRFNGGAFPLPSALPLMLTVLYLLLHGRASLPGSGTARALLLFALFFCAGWYTCCCYDERHSAPQAGREQGWLLRLLEEPEEKPRSIKLSVQLLAQTGSEQGKPVQSRALLYVYRSGAPLPFHRGDTLLYSGAWQTVSIAANPFSFDLPAYYRRNNLFVQAFAPAEKVQLFGRSSGEDDFLATRRDRLRVLLQHYFPDPGERGLMQAMLLGDESDFDPRQRQLYADTGVIHIIAISGSHLATLFSLCTALFFWLRHRKYNWLRCLPGLLLIWSYVLMAGAPPSALRAAVMFSFISLAALLNRESHPLNTLFAAAFILLLGRPFWLFSVGFQLSFLAVLALVVVYPAVHRSLNPRTWVLRQLWKCAAATLAVELLVAPLVVYYFHNFPLLFLPANIVAWLLMGVVALVGGFLLLLCAGIPVLARPIAAVLSYSIRGFNWSMDQFRNLSPASLNRLHLDTLQLLLLYAALICLLLLLVRKQRRALWPGLLFSTLFLLLCCSKEWQTLRQQRLVVYQLNNRSCIELVCGHRAIRLSADSLPLEDRALKEAHAGWGIDSTDQQTPPGDLYRIGGKTVLIWRNGVMAAAPLPFPVDVLVAEHSLRRLPASKVIAYFHPKLLVAGGNQSRATVVAWADSCRRYRIRYHATSLQGFWMLE